MIYDENILIEYFIKPLNIRNREDVNILYNYLTLNTYFNKIINKDDIWKFLYFQLKPPKLQLKYNKNNEIISEHINDENITKMNKLYYNVIINGNRLLTADGTRTFWQNNYKCSCFFRIYKNEDREKYQKRNPYETRSLYSGYREWVRNTGQQCTYIKHYKPETLEYICTEIKSKNVKKLFIKEFKRYYNIQLSECKKTIKQLNDANTDCLKRINILTIQRKKLNEELLKVEKDINKLEEAERNNTNKLNTKRINERIMGSYVNKSGDFIDLYTIRRKKNK